MYGTVHVGLNGGVGVWGGSALPKYASHQAQENIRDIFGQKPIGYHRKLARNWNIV